jgi:hypothetical protein
MHMVIFGWSLIKYYLDWMNKFQGQNKKSPFLLTNLGQHHVVRVGQQQRHGPLNRQEREGSAHLHFAHQPFPLSD